VEPLLVQPGDGEVITDRVARSLTIKAACDALTVTLMRYEQGETGPDPHVHRQHADCFYVVDGHVDFTLGAGEPAGAPAGTFVVVPPNVVHSFHNERQESALFLNFHAPSCGFRDYLHALRDGRRKLAERFDQHAPPEDGGRPASDALVATGAARCDELALAEADVASEQRDGGPVTGYWVLDGALSVTAAGADEPLATGPGGFVLVPAETAHTLEGPARVLTLTA
jgi:mannose-6-phosphate isomerase-like protein (cupin superfamily)